MLGDYEADWEGPVREKVVPGSESSTVDDDIAAGRRMLEQYWRKYQPFNEGAVLLTERKLNFELPNCPVGFTTRIDRLWKNGGGTVEICDYKTSKEIPAGPLDPSFRLQMAMYHLAVQEAFSDFKDIVLAQYYLRPDVVIRYRMRPDELDEMAELFRSEAHQIARAERLDDWPTKEAGHCRFCDYARICPAKRHQYALEADTDTPERATRQNAMELADRFLKVSAEGKRLEKELTALKIELTDAARDLGLSNLQGTLGQVSVTIRPAEKLPTRTGDQRMYAELSALVRSWGFDTCLEVNNTTLLKLYRSGRMTDEQKEKLKEFIQVIETSRVVAKPKHSLEPGDPDAEAAADDD